VFYFGSLPCGATSGSLHKTHNVWWGASQQPTGRYPQAHFVAYLGPRYACLRRHIKHTAFRIVRFQLGTKKHQWWVRVWCRSMGIRGAMSLAYASKFHSQILTMVKALGYLGHFKCAYLCGSLSVVCHGLTIHTLRLTLYPPKVQPCAHGQPCHGVCAICSTCPSCSSYEPICMQYTHPPELVFRGGKRSFEQVSQCRYMVCI